MFECFEQIKQDLELRVGEISEELFNKACEVIEQDYTGNEKQVSSRMQYICDLEIAVKLLRRVN